MIYSVKVIEKAIAEKKLYELFIGDFERIISTMASVPTDGEYIFNSWIAFLETRPFEQNKYWEEFISVLLRISKNPELCWFAMQYLYSFLEYHKRKDAYPSYVQSVITEVLINISSFSEKLKQAYGWVGSKTFDYSLWQDVVRMANILEESHPFDFGAVTKPI